MAYKELEGYPHVYALVMLLLEEDPTNVYVGEIPPEELEEVDQLLSAQTFSRIVMYAQGTALEQFDRVSRLIDDLGIVTE
jgi:hypothetical protein